MDLTKKAFVLLALGLAIGFLGCTKEQKAEAPKQEQITTNLVPAKASVTGPAFLVEVDDLKITTTIDTASKEIVETPSLKGNMKITNKSKDNLDIQGSLSIISMQRVIRSALAPGKKWETFTRSGRFSNPEKLPKVVWRSPYRGAPSRERPLEI